jgi:YHS domain-containing protein
LIENEAWVKGRQQWAVLHRGHIYTMSGPGQQQRFLANPDRYTPVFSGLDPVLLLDETREVPGKTDFCVVYDGRLYAFSSAAALAKFRQNAKLYAELSR